MSSIKEVYGLSYEKTDFNSGLTNWYNSLIDKSYDTLDVFDVSKMLRQNILKKVAIQKSVDLFLDNPYDGEYCDGGLLDLLVSVELNEIDKTIIETLKNTLSDLSKTCLDFNWEDEEAGTLYYENIKETLRKLDKLK